MVKTEPIWRAISVLLARQKMQGGRIWVPFQPWGTQHAPRPSRAFQCPSFPSWLSTNQPPSDLSRLSNHVRIKTDHVKLCWNQDRSCWIMLSRSPSTNLVNLSHGNIQRQPTQLVLLPTWFMLDPTWTNISSGTPIGIRYESNRNHVNLCWLPRNLC